jgi:uncharacterized protein (DUF486 family)
MNWLATIALLICSNVFMTFAWYYHLKHKEAWPLWMAIGISWLIALPEYILQVPANRIGSGTFTTPQLKIIQEAITLTVFGFFSIYVMGDKLRWTDIAAFVLVMMGVAVGMWGKMGG